MNTFDLNSTIPILSSLPPEARDWLTELPWQERRYLLSLCHLVCATPSAQQAEFLDAYTAEGLLSRIVDDADTRERVNGHLARFHSGAALDDKTVRRYIRQVYVHSVQDARSRPDLYLETALTLMGSAQEHNSVLSYILGFEILKLLFSMSWEQHERLYHLQPNQDDFTREYIRPIQEAHKRHNIVVPRDENNFFARREYFIRRPRIHPQRMISLIIEAFTADKIIELGFSVLRHPNAIHYDHNYIYGDAESPLSGPSTQRSAKKALLSDLSEPSSPGASLPDESLAEESLTELPISESAEPETVIQVASIDLPEPSPPEVPPEEQPLLERSSPARVMQESAIYLPESSLPVVFLDEAPLDDLTLAQNSSPETVIQVAQAPSPEAASETQPQTQQPPQLETEVETLSPEETAAADDFAALFDIPVEE